MKTYLYPAEDSFAELASRPLFSMEEVLEVVRPVFARVAAEGDAAVLEYARRFDAVSTELDSLAALRCSPETKKKNAAKLAPRLQDAIRKAATHIRLFHEAQRESMAPLSPSAGVHCWRSSVAIERVGLYIPGGTAALFSSLLMLAIPAKLAGCKEIIVCTPAAAAEEINDTLCFVAELLELEQVYALGGAQAIAALSLGTESIPKVDKIFGPGNQYVAAAKQVASAEYQTAVDLPAGPSEVLVLADESANPTFVAADLLSQAEHGIDSQVILLSTSKALVTEVTKELSEQLEVLARKEIAHKALSQSRAIVFEDIKSAFAFSNYYAPEHLILALSNARDYVDWVQNAGSVFLGHYTPETLGDYASGTNHTLPTNAAARAYSGVSLDSFVKKITFQEASPEGLAGLADCVCAMAEAEGLQAHANAVKARVAYLKEDR